MCLTSGNSDYTAKHIGLRMQFFYQQQLQCELGYMPS